MEFILSYPIHAREHLAAEHSAPPQEARDALAAAQICQAEQAHKSLPFLLSVILSWSTCPPNTLGDVQTAKLFLQWNGLYRVSETCPATTTFRLNIPPDRATRGMPALAYRPELADSCSSDSSDEDDNDAGEGGLGRRSGPRPAVSTSPLADSPGSIRHGRLLPRSL